MGERMMMVVVAVVDGRHARKAPSAAGTGAPRTTCRHRRRGPGSGGGGDGDRTGGRLEEGGMRPY